MGEPQQRPPRRADDVRRTAASRDAGPAQSAEATGWRSVGGSGIHLTEATPQLGLAESAITSECANRLQLAWAGPSVLASRDAPREDDVERSVGRSAACLAAHVDSLVRTDLGPSVGVAIPR